MVAVSRTLQSKIDKAARDRHTLYVPLYVVMARHGLSHRTAKAAVEQAEDRARTTDEWDKVREIRERDRLIDSLKQTEDKYPGICLQAVRTDNFAGVAEGHDITRERVRQISKAVMSLANILGRKPVVVAEMASKGTLPRTERERLEEESPVKANN